MIENPVQNRKGKEAVSEFRKEFRSILEPLTTKTDRAELYRFILHVGNCAAKTDLLRTFKAIALLSESDKQKVFDWFASRRRLLPEYKTKAA